MRWKTIVAVGYEVLAVRLIAAYCRAVPAEVIPMTDLLDHSELLILDCTAERYHSRRWPPRVLP